VNSTVVTDKPIENKALSADSSKKEEKQSAGTQAQNQSPNGTVSPETQKLSDSAQTLNQIAENNSKSWGDRFKSTAFGVGTHVVVNYALNTFIASAFAYVFERNFAGAYKRGIAKIVDSSKDYKTDKLALHKIENTVPFKAVNYAISAVLLTAGGTSLLPFMKHAEENRQEYLYKLSKMLDKTQSALGMANDDTQKNLDDYKKIEEIAAAKCFKKECGVSEQEIDRLEEKYHFGFQDNGDIKFDKIQIPWWDVIKARGMAITMSMTTGALLGASKGKTKVAGSVAELEAMERTTAANEERGNFGDKGFGILESKAIKPLANTLEKVPGFGKGKLVDSLHFAKLLFMDAILTVVSSATFFMASKTKDENKPSKAVLDENKDGWVSKEEAQDYKAKNANADLTGVEIDDVVQVGHHSAKVGKTAPAKPATKATPAGTYTEQVNSQRQETGANHTVAV